MKILARLLLVWLPCAMLALLGIAASLAYLIAPNHPRLQYARGTMMSTDRLAGTALGLPGLRTISAEAWRRRERLGWKQLVWLLDRIEENHCKEADAAEAEALIAALRE